MKHASARVCIVGAGAAGLTLARALHSAGIEPLICDAGKAGQGAIGAAAGMIAPAAEVAESLDPSSERHRAFWHLARHSAAIWPRWAKALAHDSGIDIGYRQGAVLVPGAPSGHCARVRANASAFAIPFTDAGEHSDIPTARGGLVFPGEAQLDAPALARALCAALRADAITLMEDAPAESLLEAGGRVTGVRLADGREIGADGVVLAAGWAAAHLHPAASGLVPVKGQALMLDAGRDLTHWPVIRGEGIYLLPKAGGRMLAGASVEPGRSDTGTDLPAREALLKHARALVPELAFWPVIDHWAGIRPALPDRMPVAGRVQPGLFLSIGGHRNGIMLAPAIAEALAGEIAGQGQDALLAPFAPPTVNEGLSSAR